MFASRTPSRGSSRSATIGAALAALSFTLSACAGLPGRDDETVTTSGVETERRDARLNDPLPDGVRMRAKKAKPAPKAAARAVPNLPSAPVNETKLAGEVAEIFRDPEFRERFIESYMSETDIEPTVTGKEEIELLRDVQTLLGQNKPNDAAQLIKDNYNERSSAAFDVILGNIYRQAEQPEEAAATYRAAVEKHPKFRRAWGLLGHTYAQQGKFKKATQALTRVIELGGGRATDYGLLGVALSNQGKYLPAQAAFQNAAMLQPDQSRWTAYLADTMMRQQRFAEAAVLLGKLIEETPDKAAYWLAQGEAYAQLKKPMRAAENFEIAEALGGATTRSLTNLGVIYANQGLYDLAAQAYVRLLEKDENIKPDAVLRAADYMIRRGAVKESRELIAGIERLRGDRLDPDTKKSLLRAKVSIARAEQLADEEAAVLAEMVENDPLDGNALIQLGRYHATKEDDIKAVSFFERAAGIEKYEAKAKIAHAELLVRGGKYQQAIPLLRTALALEENDRIANFLKQVERFAKKSK